MYKDFRGAVLDILSTLENREAELNGVAGMGRGSDDIPGSIVSVDTAPSPHRVVTEQPRPIKMEAKPATLPGDPFGVEVNPGLANSIRNIPVAVAAEGGPSGGKIPPVIFVIGGPGSNKASLCLKVVGNNPGWTHFR